jgi:hypothetical protein
MFNRFCFGTFLLACLTLPFTGCSNASSGLDSVAVTPTTASLTVGGGTLQLTATGTFGNGSHPTKQDITSQVTWTSAIEGVAIVGPCSPNRVGSYCPAGGLADGVVMATGAGTTTITASAQAYNGPTSSSATITVTAGSGGSAGGDVTSLSIIPKAQSVAAPGDTSQFIALGTTSSGATENLTSQAIWISSSTQIATVCTAGSASPCTALTDGLATAVNQGTTTITAIYTNPDLTAAEGSATLTVTNGVKQAITALTIIPGSLSLSATGQPGQFVALGTSGTTGLIEDVTDSPQLTWTSSIPSYATICTQALGTTPAFCPATPGQAEGVSPGTTNITAEYTNQPATPTTPAVVVTAQASVTVTTIAAAEPLLSITILPGELTTNNLLGTGQFLAYGTFSTAPTLMDVTNGFYHAGFPTASCTAALAAAGSAPCTLTPVNWISAMPSIFPVNSSGAPGATAGLVTADGSGNAVIYVTAQNPDGTLVYSPTVTFNCPLTLPTYNSATPPVMTDAGSCNEFTIASELLVTLTVYNAGLNTTGWLVTASSATGTPNVIHCGPGSTSGGSVCMATYPVGTTVTLTAPAETGVHFGGWSWNCESQGTVTAAGPNSCTVYLGADDPVTGEPSSNVSVGAIFN